MLVRVAVALLGAVRGGRGFGALGWGAGWLGAAWAGAFCWNLNNVSSNRNRNISSQAVNAL